MMQTTLRNQRYEILWTPFQYFHLFVVYYKIHPKMANPLLFRLIHAPIDNAFKSLHEFIIVQKDTFFCITFL